MMRRISRKEVSVSVTKGVIWWLKRVSIESRKEEAEVGKVGEGGGTEKNTNKKTQKTNSRIELENSEELFLNLGHSGIL